MRGARRGGERDESGWALATAAVAAGRIARGGSGPRAAPRNARPPSSKSCAIASTCRANVRRNPTRRKGVGVAIAAARRERCKARPERGMYKGSAAQVPRREAMIAGRDARIACMGA